MLPQTQARIEKTLRIFYQERCKQLGISSLSEPLPEGSEHKRIFEFHLDDIEGCTSLPAYLFARTSAVVFDFLNRQQLFPDVYMFLTFYLSSETAWEIPTQLSMAWLQKHLQVPLPTPPGFWFSPKEDLPWSLFKKRAALTPTKELKHLFREQEVVFLGNFEQPWGEPESPDHYEGLLYVLPKRTYHLLGCKERRTPQTM